MIDWYGLQHYASLVVSVKLKRFFKSKYIYGYSSQWARKLKKSPGQKTRDMK